MTSDTKKTKADTALKTPTAAKDKSPAADVASKPKEGEKTGEKAGETPAAAAPANYSRGEGQKPVTRAYKENWNAIFAKKKIKTKTKAKTKKKKR
jgi:hypothetical protein